MNPNWVYDEEGLVCSACGKDIYHCQHEEERLKGIGRGNKRKVAVDKSVLSLSIKSHDKVPYLS